MKYASVCSGIEAATAAWHLLGWQPVWFSEIEPFPCKVLAHHYPQVPNLGDMTKLNQNETYNNEPIDLLVGGTPCQSFSIAGLRGGLDDDRGNLALEYCRILIAKQPKWFVWENVPGVFSSNSGKDFANLLSAFTGKEINPEGLGNAGVIMGNDSAYSVAWRVLDAQYFGVPQRRRRVFVIGYLGNNWRAPYAVLFERDSLRRDFEAGAKARKGTSGTVESNTGATGKWPLGIAPTLDADYGKHYGQNNQHIDNGAGLFIETFTYKNDVDGIVEDNTSSTIKKETGRSHERNCGAYVVEAFGAQNSHHQSMNLDNVSPTLDKSKVPAICLQMGNTSSNGSNISEEVSHTLTQNDKPAVVYENHAQDSRITELNVCPAVTKKWGTGGNNVPLVEANPVCFQQNTRDEVRLINGDGELAGALMSEPGMKQQNYIATAIARRLTPLECERLQGFPDNYTNIPGAKDSPRYAAIGNSMAVPVMYWLGNRINKVNQILLTLKP